jgi:hypothetical protein
MQHRRWPFPVILRHYLKLRQVGSPQQQSPAADSRLPYRISRALILMSFARSAPVCYKLHAGSGPTRHSTKDSALQFCTFFDAEPREEVSTSISSNTLNPHSLFNLEPAASHTAASDVDFATRHKQTLSPPHSPLEPDTIEVWARIRSKICPEMPGAHCLRSHGIPPERIKRNECPKHPSRNLPSRRPHPSRNRSNPRSTSRRPPFP